MNEKEATTRATAVYDALIHRGRIDREAVIAAFAEAIRVAALRRIPESTGTSDGDSR